MRPADPDCRDGLALKRRRIDDYDLDLSSILHLPQYLPQQLPIRSTDHSTSYQAIQYAPYSTATDEGPSSRPWGPMVQTDAAIDNESLMEGEDVDLSQCCFGMLCRIPVKVKGHMNSNSRNVPVIFQSPSTLLPTVEKEAMLFEISSLEASATLDELESAQEIGTQLYCLREPDLQLFTRPKGRQRARMSQIWSLNVIIYGSVVLEETVGNFLSTRRMYLQHPVGCGRDVPYRNPHILSQETERIIMTGSLDVLPGNIEIERLEVGPDLLAQLMEDEDPLDETDAPAGVTTPLFSHQKQALTFLRRREQGWAMDTSDRDIWSKVRDKNGRISYRNNVSGSCQAEPPPRFRGGLLADDMGLGKTLSMICLIAANRACQSLPSPPITPQPVGNLSSSAIKSTLLIVPPPLIQTWEKQLSLHLQPGLLQCYVYHGQNRKEVKLLPKYDVVITTYYTVSSIWRQMQQEVINSRDSIFSMDWHRIVLDEAHIIQNRQSDLAQSCCDLRSSRRWAITGTPIQNKLTDFASIIKFLQVYPYSEDGVFEDEISRPWQKEDPQGFLRLKTLVRNITISRTKAVVSLPPRMDEIHHLDFSLEEREKYDLARLQTVAMLEEAIASTSQRRNTFNALKRLNMLRLICSHGLLTRNSQQSDFTSISPNPIMILNEAGMQEPIVDPPWTVPTTCSNCGTDLLEDVLMGSQISHTETHGQSSSSLCGGCCLQIDMIGSSHIVNNGYRHLSNFDTPGVSSPGSPMEVDHDVTNIDAMSTKVKALVADLSNHCSNEKSVVFSYWTYSLDLVGRMLDSYKIAFTRIDGKTPLPKRLGAMDAFQKNDLLRVILVSITCGGAGLDLTAASRVYLLEPHWNPMIEEQALCRVHRVGQRRNVTTVRYLMRDSFEEQVVEIQKRKKLLAKVTFSQGPLSETGIGLGTLQYLKAALE